MKKKKNLKNFFFIKKIQKQKQKYFLKIKK
jgi:hypothetical protein